MRTRTPENSELGQKGTRELLTRYGLSLLCVRYRYADDTRESLKTVELVVQRRSRDREAVYPGSRKLDGRVWSAARRRVALRIGWRETDLRRVKSAGGRWDTVRRDRMLTRDVVEGPDLLNCVVGGGG